MSLEGGGDSSHLLLLTDSSDTHFRGCQAKSRGTGLRNWPDGIRNTLGMARRV